MSTTHNLDRLPRWAQIEITNLRARVEKLESERVAGSDDTDTYVNHVANLTTGPEAQFQRLKRGAEIVFWDQPGWPRSHPGRITAQWSTRLRVLGRPGLEIRTSGIGQMVVTPHASNVVYVYEGDVR